MKTKVTFSGGFHNSKAISLYMNFSNEALCDYADGQIGATDLIDENLTPYQRKRLERHFCGIKGCMCGHWHRADIDKDEITKNAEHAQTIRRMRDNKRSPLFEKFTGSGVRCDVQPTAYEIKNPEEFAEKYAAENGYARYEIVTMRRKFSASTDVYFSGDGLAIGFFK